MNSRYPNENQVLESLKKSVSKTLERKRRLGQYAVVWHDGKPAHICPNAPKPADQ